MAHEHHHNHTHTHKPEAVKQNGTYNYTLSSYSPLHVEVTIPYILDSDVEITAQNFLTDINPNKEEVTDEWLKDHLDDIDSFDKLYSSVREQLELLNEKFVKDQVRTKCITQLTLLLEQKVPTKEIEAMQQVLLAKQAETLQSQDITKQQYAEANDTTTEDINNALYNYAATLLEQQAALDAFIKHEDIACFDFEVALKLQITEEQVKALASNDVATSALDQIRQDIKRDKAANKAVHDATVSYLEETKEEALAHKAHLEQNM